jgi:fibronectin-binding autotransporter adhesin
MATYTTNLRLTKITVGDESGTWGATTNSSLEYLDKALGYVAHVNSDGDETITISDGSTSDASYLYIKITGTLTGTRTITIAPDTLQKVWIIENATTGSQVINIKQGSGAEIAIAASATAVVYMDGAGAGGAVFNALGSIIVPSITTGAIAATTITGSGVLSIDDTTDSTSTTTGSIHTDGGLGIAKALWVGTTSRFVGVTTHGGNVVSDTDSTDDLGTTGVRWANLWVDAITMGGALTASGGGALTGTWSDLGTVTTVDINGGTVGGVTLDGTISGAPTWASNQAITLSTAAQANITSLGTLTALQVDNLNLNGNTLSATTGAVNITPLAGSAIVLDATISVDAGVVTGATSITSTTFVGDVTGNVSGTAPAGTLTGATLASGVVTSSLTTVGTLVAGAVPASLVTAGTLGTGAYVFDNTVSGITTLTATTLAGTLSTAAQANVTSLGTLTALQVDNLNVNLNTISATTGAINITPAVGSAILLDGTVSVDAGVVTGATSITSTAFVGAVTGNSSTATALETARTIGGTSFDGTANIAVGLAATATALATARTIGGTSFDGTANIAVGLSATSTALATARAINGVNFDGTAAITITAAAGTLSGATLASGVTSSSLTSVGTIGTGTWSATAIAVDKGGTAITSYAAGDILYASGTATLAKLAKGSDTQVLTLVSGVPSWATPTVGDLTAIVAGTGLSGTDLSGPIPTLNVDASQTQITALGTIGTGVWQGTKVASAYLDDDTAHLSGTQTFSGAKTFSAALVASSTLAVTGTSTLTGAVTATGGVVGNLTGNITGTAPAGTLTGATLASGVTASSLTSVGTITSLVATTADINGGTVDGATVGASSASSGAFTTLAASSTLAVTGATTLSSTLAVTGATTLTGNVHTLGIAAVGAVTNAAVALNITSDDVVGVNQYGINVNPLFRSGATTSATGVQIVLETEGASFTMANGYGLHVGDASKGAGSTITTQYGIKVENQTKGGTNYAIHTGTGAVSFGSTLAVTGASTLQGLTVGSASATGAQGRVTLDSDGTGGNMVSLTLKKAGSTVGVIAPTGHLLGTTADDFGIFAETGKNVYLWGGGQTTNGVKVDGTSTTVTGTLAVTGTITPSAANGTGLIAFENDASANTWTIYHSSGGTVLSLRDIANGVNLLDFTPGATPSVGINGTLSVTGNVGIGTTAPSNELDVFGDISLGSKGEVLVGSNIGTLGFWTNDTNVGLKSVASIFVENDGPDYWGGAASNRDTRMKFRVLQDDIDVDALTILSSGYVGIGTTTPKRNFHVSAAAGAEVVVTSNDMASGFRNFNIAADIAGTDTWNIRTLSDDFLALGTALMSFDQTGNTIVHGALAVTGNIATNQAIGYNPLTSSADSGSVFVSGQLQIGVDSDVCIYANRKTNDGTAVAIRSRGVAVGSISVTSSATAYNTSSDVRLKTDKGLFTDTSILRQTLIHRFVWKESGAESFGVFAQEAQTVHPGAVHTGEKGDMWGVDYSKYVTPLIVGWQDHEARIAALTARLEAAGL